MKRQEGFIGALVAIAIVLAVLIIPLLNIFYVYGTQQDRTITVNKTERVNSTDNSSSKYLVYAEEGVFENTDSLLRLKFNSSDVYNDVKEGKTYVCDTYGWRIPFFSQYPNIVSCEEKSNE